MSGFPEPTENLGSRLFFQGRKFQFEVKKLRLPNGIQGEWECIRHPGGALAVPVTNDGRLLLVRQYRFAVQSRIIEFPAGTLEIGEKPEVTIQREIEEETGYTAGKWRNLGKFPLAPGYSDEYIYAFLAQELKKLPQPPSQDEDEDIEVVFMTPVEFEQLIQTNCHEIDAKTVYSYFLARPFFI
jgi:ADP-ribose pyrophosphatase